LREFFERNKNIILKLVFMTVFVLFVYVFFRVIFRYIAPFVVGYLLSLVLNPLATFLSSKFRMKRWLSALLSMGIMFTIVYFILRGIILRIVSEGSDFFYNFPDIIETAREMLDEIQVRYENFYNIIPTGLQVLLEDFWIVILDSVTETVGSGIRTGGVNVVTTVPSFILGFLVSMISCYFFIKDKELISKKLIMATPEGIKKPFRKLRPKIKHSISGYLKAQFTIMSIVAAICATGMLILRVPYALFLAIIIAIVDALPLLGSGLFFIPWALFSLITGQIGQGIGLLVIYGCVMITRQIIEPRIVGKQIGVHPIITLMAIYVGLRVFGVFGILMGPFFIIIIKGIIDTKEIM